MSSQFAFLMGLQRRQDLNSGTLVSGEYTISRLHFAQRSTTFRTSPGSIMISVFFTVGIVVSLSK